MKARASRHRLEHHQSRQCNRQEQEGHDEPADETDEVAAEAAHGFTDVCEQQGHCDTESSQDHSKCDERGTRCDNANRAEHPSERTERAKSRQDVGRRRREIKLGQ